MAEKDKMQARAREAKQLSDHSERRDAYRRTPFSLCVDDPHWGVASVLVCAHL